MRWKSEDPFGFFKKICDDTTKAMCQFLYLMAHEQQNPSQQRR